MSDSDKVKSQAMIDTSDSDTDVSDSEFRNVAKKPRLEDQGNVSLPQHCQTPTTFIIYRSLAQALRENLPPLPQAVLPVLEMNGRGMKKKQRRKSKYQFVYFPTSVLKTYKFHVTGF